MLNNLSKVWTERKQSQINSRIQTWTSLQLNPEDYLFQSFPLSLRAAFFNFFLSHGTHKKVTKILWHTKNVFFVDLTKKKKVYF